MTTDGGGSRHTQGETVDSSALPSPTTVPTVRAEVTLPVEFEPGTWADASLLAFAGLSDAREHIALVFDQPTTTTDNPLVRLHSECLTGDVFGSARCDCGPQLAEALRTFAEHGGIILYLRQEGRGIGLYNKLDAYLLQDEGLDTFAANRALDFSDDARSYVPAAEMLTALGIEKVRLLTNNPDKVAQLAAAGIQVTAVEPTDLYLTASNVDYLAAKAELAGHTLTIDPSLGTE